MEERLTLISGLKWVDEVITNAPYEINEKFMNILFNDYKIDYIIHVDDPCLLPDGTDAYALAKKVGWYKQIKRTEGVSSTDIVGRILSLRSTKLENGTVNASSHEQLQNGENTPVGGSVKSHLSNFLPTSRRIVQFSNGKGHPPGSINVQIYRLIKEWTAWDIARRAAFAFFGIFSGTEENPEFIQSVESKLDKDDKIIVACSSGGTMRPSQNLPEDQQSRQKTSLQRLL